MLDPAFKPILDSFSQTTIEYEAGTVYAIWPDFRLAYFNEAWRSFARDNGPPRNHRSHELLGMNVLEATAPALRPFYARLFSARLRGEGPTRGPLVHEYECSSARDFRRYAMCLYRLGEGQGLLIVNSLMVERPHDPSTHSPRDAERAAYVGENGLITQCANCRRTRHAEDEERWDWIPAWVDSVPKGTSHTLCRHCFDAYWTPRIDTSQR